jgi:hypothetical protein
MRTCKRCGQPFKGWWCRCGKKGKRGGRPRRVMSVGCGTRGWRLQQARARMLGGGAGWPEAGETPEGAEACEDGPGDELRDGSGC